MAGMGNDATLLIDGLAVSPKGGGVFEVINPATEAVLAAAPDAGPAEMAAAIGAARRAFDQTEWRDDLALRVRCIEQLRDAVVGAREDFREEMVAEVGCTITSTYSSRLDPPINRSFDWYLEIADRFPWSREEPVVEAGGRRSSRTVHKEGIGVVAAITAWNSPLELALAKLVPALLTGNTVVLKPSPEAPLSTLRLGRLIHERTDIPAGVVNVVASSDHQLGAMLSTDPRVDFVSFTGSAATGRRIMAGAAPTLKGLQLELGGKAAHVVLDDADFEQALRMSMNICLNAGQSCGAMSRLLVPRRMVDEVASRVADLFADVVVGDPMDPAVEMGPVISERQRENVLTAVDRALTAGAKAVHGGGVPTDLFTGYYVEPTLLTDVDRRNPIAQEEVFGPVLAVMGYDDDADAVAITNDIPYGLSAAVTGSHNRAMAMARRIRAGAVSVNGGATFARDVPFGGYKQSGLGRQNGIEGLEAMLETKTVAASLA